MALPRRALPAFAALAITAAPACRVRGPAAPPPPAERAEPPASAPEAPEEGTSQSEAEDTEPDLLTDDGTEPPHGASDAHPHPSASGAVRYAGLDRASCEAELGRRHIAWTSVGEARGVVAPLRLAGPLSGVTFRSNLPESKSRTSPYDIYDCRLVLALDDFARVLSRHDIVEVVHLSVYRPASPKLTLKGPGRRHTGALAIDAALFKTKDGRTLSVEKDFHGRIGAKPCPARETASELRKIACEAHDAGLFNVLLTPDFNWAHRNHFHLEVTVNVKWTLVR